MLKDYGRLLKDGELKVKAHSDNKSKTRYTFEDSFLYLEGVINTLATQSKELGSR